VLCAECGTENRTGSRFCDNCGAPLSSSCPACGEPNRSDARFCASCGGQLIAATAADPADGPEPSPTATPASTAERRLVTVVFTDLVGFTTLAEDRDPEAVRELLSRYFAAATQTVTLHGGTVEKFIGDAVMAVWGTPIAHEDDAERAVRAALEIVDVVPALHAGLEARAGVLTGEAAVTLATTNQGMVAGDLVNTAARLQGVAEPGTVLVGEATRIAAERSVLFEPLGDHSLKGKTSPVPAWRAVRVVAARGGQGRTDALEPPFVGRDEELRQLKEHLHAAGRDRRPRLISITGSGGIGKSRLVWELEKYVDGVTEDVWWHRGRSPSYGEGISFWALGEMVRRRASLAEDDDEATTRMRIRSTVEAFVAETDSREDVAGALLALLGVEDVPAGGRDALFPAWRTFFEQIAERGTTVLVFEDLQWADSGLLDFIDHLLDWSRPLPMVIITLARSELFDRRPDWGAGRRNFASMTLDPLKPDEMRRMLEGLVPGLPEDLLSAIVTQADGVPLYAVETVRALLSQGRLERVGEEYRPVGDLSKLAVPASLRSLIASRLDALAAEEHELLQAASVLGQVFAAPALAAVTGRSEAEVNESLRTLHRRELLQLETDPASPERGQFKFMQGLIREVAYGTMGRRDRRALHLAAARHYESVGDDELAGALASHYLAALEASDEGPEAAALATQARLALRGAGERAGALGAHQQALRHYEQALTVTTDSRERAELLVAAASSAGMAATGTGPSLAAAAAAAYREIGDTVGAARALGRQGALLIDASRLEEAAEVLEEALASAAGDAPEVEAELAANLSRAYMRMVRPDEAIATADRALTIAERLNLDDVVAEALINKGSAIGMLGRRREAVSLAEGAVRLATGGLPSREMRIRHNLAVHLLEDEPRRALDQLRATLDVARRVGDHGHFVWVLGTIVWQSLAAGIDLDEVVAMAREALEVTSIAGDRGRLRAAIAAVEVARGEDLETVPAAMDAIYGDSTDPEEAFYRDLPKAQVSLARGDLEEAYRLGMRIGQLKTQATEFGLLVAFRAATALRDVDRLRPVAARVFDLPGTGLFPSALRVLSAAAVAALEGRRGEAVAAFRDTRQILRRLENWYDYATAAVDAITLLPDEAELLEWAAEARPILERVRAAPALASLDATLANRGSSEADRAGAHVSADLVGRG
jgi:class 3 adenylate cyclase/tetratricopeptide (TPR) repeat protein